MAADFIHWFPGHIAKARRQLKEELSRIDLILEIVDARVPRSSFCPDSKTLIGEKLRIVLLNKSDVADNEKTKVWKDIIEKECGCPCILTTAKNQKDRKYIINKILTEAKPVFKKLESKGLLPRPIRVMVIGMPNVGKSSIINKLTGCAKTKTGAKAGVTRVQQWVRVHSQIELLDTPGIVPPAKIDQNAAVKLAMVSSISENAYDNEFAARELLKILEAHYKEITKKYYGIEDNLTVENIALKRNWILKGKSPDVMRAAQFILDNFRSGKIGKITLDMP